MTKLPISSCGAANVARALRYDPAHRAGGSIPSRRSPPLAVPARPRPHHPLERLPPPEAQDAGVHPPRRRPFPHAPHPHAGGGADRPLDRPRRSGSTKIWPRRWRSRTTSATRPSAMPARRALDERSMADMAASTTTPRACASSPSSSGATRLRRAQSDLRDAEGLVKHNGPLIDAAGRPIEPHAGGALPLAMRAYPGAAGPGA